MKLTLAFLLLGATVASAPRPIAIVINGDTLALQPPPRVDHGLLFVPVRRTLEALGLSFDRSGNRVTTQVGSKTVALVIGSRIADVDGGRLQLEAPPIEVAGVLYAPLRFFTDVLGAQAHFDRKANAVIIVAQLVGRSSNGLVSTPSGYERFGTVAAVDVLSDPPTLTLGYGGGVKTIPIAANAILEVEDVNVNVTSPGELGDVRPGDFARLEMRKDGRVERVVDEYGSRNGHIVAIAGNDFVLGDGQVIGAGRTTEISLNGKAASMSDLRPDDQVTVRYNVETNEVREILASRSTGAINGSASGGVGITSVESDASRPLRAGDTIHVTLHGTPHGSATFDIGSDVANQAMQERMPSVYVGSYTVPQGANFDDAAVIGRLSSGNSTAEAAAAHTVSASSVPPGIADFAPEAGTTVNTNRPAVYASFAADAVGVNPSSVLLWINGRDVTAECVRTAQFVQYLPSYAYPDGPIHVTVRVADEAGEHDDEVVEFLDPHALRNYMADCVFCKIAAGELPAKTVARDDLVVAIEDLNPQAPTHLLVMPIRHHANVQELAKADRALAARLLEVASKLGAERGGAGFRLVFNTGRDGGQTVDHVHVHVLAGRHMDWPPG